VEETLRREGKGQGANQGIIPPCIYIYIYIYIREKKTKGKGRIDI
jgi:hypothetical protein